LLLSEPKERSVVEAYVKGLIEKYMIDQLYRVFTTVLGDAVVNGSITISLIDGGVVNVNINGAKGSNIGKLFNVSRVIGEPREVDLVLRNIDIDRLISDQSVKTISDVKTGLARLFTFKMSECVRID